MCVYMCACMLKDFQKTGCNTSQTIMKVNAFFFFFLCSVVKNSMLGNAGLGK